MTQSGSRGFYGHSAKPGRSQANEGAIPQWGPPAAGPTQLPSPLPPAPTASTLGGPATSPIAPPPMVEGVMARAKTDDPRALKTLFEQFIPPGEQIVETRYMGVMGIWGFGTHSFAAVTTHRVASIKVGLLGELLYQDGSLEYINSSAVYQPSRLKMYMPAIILVLFVFLFSFATLPAVLAIFTTLLAVLLTPLIIKWQYRIRKSGLVVWVREGLNVYVFIDRPRIALANRFYRLACELRDERLREIGHP